MTMPNGQLTLAGQFHIGGVPAGETIGAWMSCVRYDPTIDRTIWTTPTKLPLDFDTSRPSIVTTQLGCINVNNTPALNAVFRLLTTQAPTLGTPINTEVEVTFPIPNPWPVGDTIELLTDAGAGYTFPGGFFAPTQRFGFAYRRTPGAALDNYPNPIKGTNSLTLLYYRRCQKVCC